MIELVMSLGVIGLAIWLTGVLGLKVDDLSVRADGQQRIGNLRDVFGGGGSFDLACPAGYFSRIGLDATDPAVRVTAAGHWKSLQTIALARLAWSLHLTMNTGMDVRRALKLSLRSTQNARYIDQIETIDAEIMAGNSIHQAFVAAGGYPVEFLDTLAVGEQSGKMVESMGHLANNIKPGQKSPWPRWRSRPALQSCW